MYSRHTLTHQMRWKWEWMSESLTVTYLPLPSSVDLHAKFQAESLHRSRSCLLLDLFSTYSTVVRVSVKFLWNTRSVCVSDLRKNHRPLIAWQCRNEHLSFFNDDLPRLKRTIFRKTSSLSAPADLPLMPNLDRDDEGEAHQGQQLATQHRNCFFSSKPSGMEEKVLVDERLCKCLWEPKQVPKNVAILNLYGIYSFVHTYSLCTALARGTTWKCQVPNSNKFWRMTSWVNSKDAVVSHSSSWPLTKIAYQPMSWLINAYFFPQSPSRTLVLRMRSGIGCGLLGYFQCKAEQVPSQWQFLLKDHPERRWIDWFEISSLSSVYVYVLSEITRSCVGDRYASVGCKGTGGNVHCECDSDYCNETNTITSSMSLLLLAITSLVAKFLL